MSQIEAAIRSGQMLQARTLLTEIPKSEIPRVLTARTANLARRCGAHHFALRLLAPLIRPQKILERPASAEERLSYAATLLMIGATHEGMTLLETIPAAEFPEALFFRSLGFISQWKYGSAIPALERYLQSLNTNDYAYRVGVTNLAASFIVRGRYQDADACIAENIRACQTGDYRLLLSNNFVLAAQSSLAQDNLALARQHLRSARAITAPGAHAPQALIDKWDVITALRSPESRTESVAKAHALRSQWSQQGYWENVRDIDFHLAKTLREDDRFWSVYWGSPFTSYRRKIKLEYGPVSPNPEALVLGDAEGDKTLSIYDTVSGRSLSGRLVRALLTDHYQPLRIGTLFSKLYPGQYFDPFSSQHRIEQAVYRLRELSRLHDWGLSVQVVHGSFQLRAEMGRAIRLTTKRLSLRQADPRHDWLLSHPRFQSSPFSCSDVADILRISIRNAQRLLNMAHASGWVIRRGNGRATQYQARLGLPHARVA
ncbi:MAG: hypothetical protein NDI61_03180 [Bdellovibrionaceae bacterium]|nr:hypothetical protein [Pseudobdellovibrionaceae bacterium]